MSPRPKSWRRSARRLIYRVHDQPSKEKLAALARVPRHARLKLPKTGNAEARRISTASSPRRERARRRARRRGGAAQPSQAEYSPGNFGHFGLNLRRYAHFTSPIRRYADLIVHRALIRALELGKDGLDRRRDRRCSRRSPRRSPDTERRAMAAERETADRLIAAYLADRIGATLPRPRLRASPAPGCSCG